MSGKGIPLLLHHVRDLIADPTVPDERLLDDYLMRRDEAAFTSLIARHGPMVLNLCRRILHDGHAAEDVFQSAFLVLAKQADAIRSRASLASWLHGVTYRLAVRAKRRRGAEVVLGGEVATMDPAAGPADALAWQEMLSLLDEELTTLPDRFQAPLVLCYLEGCTRDEAARMLGWSVATLRRRLDQGRHLLEARLRTRGVSLSAALGGLLAVGTAAVSAPLQAATVAVVVGSSLSAAKKGAVGVSTAWIRILVMLGVCGPTLGMGYWLSTASNREAELTPSVAREGAETSDKVFRLAKEAVEDCEPNFLLLLELGVQEAKRGNGRGARHRFQQAVDRLADNAPSQRVTGLVLVAHRLAQAGDRDASMALLAEARRLAPTIPQDNARNDLLRFAAVCLAEEIDPVMALIWASEIPDENCRLNAFRSIAVAQARAGDLAGTRRTIERIRTRYSYFRIEPWNALAAAELKAGEPASAEKTLHRTLAAIEEKRREKWGDGLSSEVEALVSFAVAQSRAGDQVGARRNFARVEKLLTPDSRPEPLPLLATLALGQAEAGERAAAARTIQRYLRAANQYEVDPEAAALASILPARLALNDHDAIARAARRIHNPETLRQVCEALAATGREETAVALAREQMSAESRAWGLLGAGSGALKRLPPHRLPRHAGTLLVALRTRRPAPKPPQTTAPDPMQQMHALVEKWEQAWAKFNERLDRAKTEQDRRTLLENDRPNGEECARGLLALTRKYPSNAVGVDALVWIVEHAPDTAAAKEALLLFRRDHLASKKAGEVCSLAVHCPHRDAVEQLLRAAQEKSPHRATKGQACLALAHFLRDQANQIRAIQRQRTPEGLKIYERMHGPDRFRQLRSSDPAKFQGEAERLYEQVLAQFADVFPQRHSESLGKQARAALDEIRLLAMGRPAPEIQGDDTQGKQLRLSDYRGKVVVLVFWATWCRPCLEMIPHEKALTKRLAGKPFVLLGVNGDGDRAKLDAWLKKNPLPWRSWRDGRENGQGPIARAWNVSSWPTVYVIDAEGILRHRDLLTGEMDEAVDRLLAEMSKRPRGHRGK